MFNSQNNILSRSVLRKVQNIVFGNNIAWYAGTTDYRNEDNPDPNSFSFAHFAFNQGQSTSPLGDMLEIAALTALDQVGENVDHIMRIRLGLHTITPAPFVGGPHIDTEQPHRVALIYLDNSDGDTVLYNEVYDPGSNLKVQDYLQQVLNNQVTVESTSTPEENKMIWFDGRQFHSSIGPSRHARRCVININYRPK